MKSHASIHTIGLSLVLASVAIAACSEQPATLTGTPASSGATVPVGSATATSTGPGSGSAGGEDAGDGGAGPTSSVGSGSAVTAHDLFTNEVYPLLSSNSDNGLACTTCHAVGTAGAPVFFATSGADGSYNAITNYSPSLIAIPANSNIVQHGPHAGPALDADQLEAVTAWLDKEVEERGLSSGSSGVGGGETGTGGGEPADPPVTLSSALAGFGDCMQISTWFATGMDHLPETQTEIGPCKGCHNAGDGGTWLSANDEETFARNRMYPYVKRLVTGTVDENGAFDGLLAARRFIEKGQEACNPDLDNCHPQFVLPPDTEQAVTDFVALTLDRWENGPCDPNDQGELPPSGGN